MADTVAITAGVGTSISTEEITTLNGGSVAAQHVQRLIPAIRTADGTAVDVTSSDPLPIEMVAGTLTLDGEAHIGEVGGSTVIITPTITVTAGAYSANDVVGGEITLTNAMRVSSGSGVIQSLTVHTADGETPALIFMFYDSNPAANTADNGAFAWGSGDIGRWLGKVDVATADYATQGGDGIATKTGIGLPVAASGSQNLYMYIICTGTPTFSATTDLTVRVGILQD